MAGTYSQAVVGELVSTGDPKILEQLKGMNEELDSSNDLQGVGISKGFMGRWYTPTVIATEQERENAAFGKLTTPDEVTGVVMPANGVMVIAYRAIVKTSVTETGTMAIFLGANQLKKPGATTPELTETKLSAGTGFQQMVAGASGLVAIGGGTSYVTTGETIGLTAGSAVGLCFLRAEAGTYAVSVQFKASSGKIAAKERTLTVGVIGGT